MPTSMNRSGIAQLEAADAAVRRQVGVEHDELRMTLGEIEQRLAVRLGDVLGRVLQPRLAARRPRSRARPRGSSRARPRAAAPARARARRGRAPRTPRRSAPPAPRTRARTPRRRARPACQRYVPPPSSSATGCSMNETPLPLIVCAISTFGRSRLEAEVLERLAQRRRGRARRSVSTYQPKRRSFSSRSPRPRISSVRLVRLQLVAVDDHDRGCRSPRARRPGAPPSSGPPGARRRRS